jgi:hypothetical protein
MPDDVELTEAMTEAMIEAGVKAFSYDMLGKSTTELVAAIYRAMHAASTPSPVSVEEVAKHMLEAETHPPGGARELVPPHTIRAVMDAIAALSTRP